MYITLTGVIQKLSKYTVLIMPNYIYIYIYIILMVTQTTNWLMTQEVHCYYLDNKGITKYFAICIILQPIVR